MSRIAVTGASGFVARALLARLQHEGVEVFAISRSSTDRHSCASISYFHSDYLDVSALAAIFRSCDVVIHLAALAHQSSQTSASLDIDSYRHANTESLRAVAQAASRAAISRLVFVSSIGVNGASTHGIPFTESDIPQPAEPYSISKLEAELVLASELSTSSTDWVVLRPPLVYGPGCPGNLQRLVKYVSTAPIIPFGSLHALRSLISIDNLCDALFIASTHPAVSRRVFVVADLEDIDVAGIIRALLLGLGRGAWRLIPFPPFLIKAFLYLLGRGALWRKFSSELRVDSSAFCRSTGWTPSVSPHEGIRLSMLPPRVN